MLKHILLLTPVYVTFFWTVILNADNRVSSQPRKFLGKFMFFAFIVYLAHLFYFVPYRTIYIQIDPLYQLASLLVFPMYHIYFRLLTVENKFSIRKHGVYFLPSVILFILYLIGVFIAPFNDYADWVFNRNFISGSVGIQFLKIVDFLIRLTFLIQVFWVVIANYILVKKHGLKAGQYYSDLSEAGTINVSILNGSMIITGVSSIVLASLGRNFFANENTGIALASIIFSSMLFIIGWLGNKQNSLNPLIKAEKVQINTDFSDISSVEQKYLLDKILVLFQEKKIYLNSKLTIQDVAQEVGTNRTYISTIINQQFNQNFCNFVNNYRVDELEKVIFRYPEFNNILLAETCGFGSVDSLKRAVVARTGKKLTIWRKETLLKRENSKIG